MFSVKDKLRASTWGREVELNIFFFRRASLPFCSMGRVPVRRAQGQSARQSKQGIWGSPYDKFGSRAEHRSLESSAETGGGDKTSSGFAQTPFCHLLAPHCFLCFCHFCMFLLFSARATLDAWCFCIGT